MLKKRIIPTLLLKEGRLHKGKNFTNYKDVGDPLSVLKIYSNQYADELILINIGRKKEDFDFLLKSLNKSTENCFIPLTAGGGIKNLDQATELFKNGADKIILTSSIIENPNLIKQISIKYGRQAVVAGIDIDEKEESFNIVHDKERKYVNYCIVEYIKKLEQLGAGEILFNFVCRDGMMNGTNIKLLKKLCNYTKYPTICMGGIGNISHIIEVFNNTSCDAIACSSIFHFADNNPIRIRSSLKNKNIPQRKVK